MELELNGNVMSLGGDPNISTGVTGAVQLSGNLQLVQILLRDVLVTSFLSGFREPKSSALPLDAALEPIMHALLQLACILTDSDVA